MYRALIGTREQPLSVSPVKHPGRTVHLQRSIWLSSQHVVHTTMARIIVADDSVVFNTHLKPMVDLLGLVTSVCVRALSRKSYLAAATQEKSAGHDETWTIMSGHAATCASLPSRA